MLGVNSKGASNRIMLLDVSTLSILLLSSVSNISKVDPTNSLEVNTLCPPVLLLCS